MEKMRFEGTIESVQPRIKLTRSFDEREHSYLGFMLRLNGRAESDDIPPPWIGEPPTLEVYRDRGHRRLASQVYNNECRRCIWGCRMAVEMIIDHWKPDIRKYRDETFCYGPLSCPLYRPGPTRKVPGRKGMTWEEEDWVDEQDTNHREPDE